MIDLKKEAKFVVRTYLSNIFTLWGFFLIATYWLSFNPLVNKFRTMLWANQFHWLILVPFLVYVGLEVHRKYKTKHKGISKMAFIIGLVSGVGVGVIFLDYAFFTAGIIMIIPEQHHETKKDPIEYDKVEKTIKFGEFFVVPLVNVAQLRLRKRFEYNGDIQLAKEFGKKTKIISICVAFTIALTWVIYYNNVNSFWNLTFN